MPGNWGLVDLDTPKEVYTKQDYVTGKTWELVFSDEFNTDGRTFYPGDDPYWEAVDLHYWQTNNMEWYDPAAITTKNGSLEITLSQMQTHGMDYQGGMMSTWNKFCFTGGLVEASVVLPGTNNIVGLWPAIWTMGNLGRAGYGASLEGMVCAHLRWMSNHADEVLCSGLTLTTPATSGQLPTRPSMVCPLQRRKTVIPAMAMRFPICLASVCHAAHALASRTQDLFTPTTLTSVVPPLRLIYLRLRYVHSQVLFLSMID